jgi:hypothetical protein
LDGRNLRTPNKEATRASANTEQFLELTRAYAREKLLREELEKALKENNSSTSYTEQINSLRQENEYKTIFSFWAYFKIFLFFEKIRFLKQQILELKRSCHAYDVTPLTQTPNGSDIKTHSDLSPNMMSRTSSYSNSNNNADIDRRKRNLSNNEKKVRFVEDSLSEQMMQLIQRDKKEMTSSRKSSASLSRNSDENSCSEKELMK